MTQQQEQQLKARFFGMHIGCSVNVTGMAEYKNGGVTWDENGTFSFFDGFEYHLFDENCKLILRPLSSITDEEAVNCARLNPRFPVGTPIEVYTNQFGMKVVSPVVQPLSEVVFDAGNMTPIQYDYLRSLNFCLPFQGIDPIEAGWAILEETPQKT